jgi:hypothetical protein
MLKPSTQDRAEGKLNEVKGNCTPSLPVLGTT